MKFSYNWLKELVPGLPGPAETAGLLTRHALEVEETERSGDDWYLDVDVLPNRMADASSHRGIARELAAILTMQPARRGEPHPGTRGGEPDAKPVTLTLPDEQAAESGAPAAETVSVTIEDKQGCSFYASRVVRGVSVGESPDWLKNRLRVLGLEPINNIVDITNYVMLEFGQPLHAFDAANLAGGEIIVRRAKKGEEMAALDGETYTLSPEVTVIADRERAVAIAGIKGGVGSGVSENTDTIVLESAVFDPRSIYRSSRIVGIRTDASKRFEAGRTAAVTVAALDRAAALMEEIAGGEVAEGVVTAGNAETDKKAIAFDAQNAERLLGIAVDTDIAKRALEALGCTVSDAKEHLLVNPPDERTDLSIEEDLIEEVGRLSGYDVRDDAPPLGIMTPASLPDVYRWADKARDILAGEGLFEVMRYSFVSEALMERWGMQNHPYMAEMANPQSADYTHLRPSLLPNLLEMAESERKTRDSVRIFEVGSAFMPKKDGESGEYQAVAGVLAEADLTSPAEFLGEHAAYFEAKGVVEALLEGLGIPDAAFVPMRETYGFWAEGRTAMIQSGEVFIGMVGELSADAMQGHEAMGAVAAFELHMERLAEVASGEHAYRSPSKYPEVMRDVAILVPLDVTADEVNQLMVTAGPDWLRDVDLFDYYEGDQVPEGMKSLAFRLIYQSDERTLTDSEVNEAQEKVEEALRKQGWEIR